MKCLILSLDADWSIQHIIKTGSSGLGYNIIKQIVVVQGAYYRNIQTLKSYLMCLVTIVISVRTTFRTKAITEQHFLSALSYLNYR